MKGKAGKIIRIILWIFIVIASIYIAYGIYRESRIRDYDETTMQPSENSIQEEANNGEVNNTENEVIDNNVVENNQTQNEPTKKPSSTPKPTASEEKLPAGVPTTYKGYTVSSRLTIPRINLDTYVFKNYSKATLDTGLTKYYGPEPNEVGNYCIAGHNFLRKNMFGRLTEVKKGDKMTLTDRKNGAITYEVYDIYKVKPEQTEVLSQETNGKKEITLITCSDYTSKRIIVKAREET